MNLTYLSLYTLARPGIFCLLCSSDQFTIWSCCSSKNGLFTSFLGWGLRPYSDHARPSWTCRKKHSKGPWQATACFGGAGWLTWPHYFNHKWAQTSRVQGVLALCEFHYCEFHCCGFSKLSRYTITKNLANAILWAIYFVTAYIR